MTDLTKDQINILAAMARMVQDETGKLPATITDIANYWYKLQEEASARAEREQNPEIISMLVGTDHTGECIWLRELERRPDADALLAQALAAERDGGEAAL